MYTNTHTLHISWEKIRSNSPLILHSHNPSLEEEEEEEERDQNANDDDDNNNDDCFVSSSSPFLSSFILRFFIF